MPQNKIPHHVACILDGNRRWAKKEGVTLLKAYNAGGKNVETIARHAGEQGVKYLSVFALSTENLGRVENDLNSVYSVFRHFLKEYIQSLGKEDVQIRFLGRLHLLPEDIQTSCRELMESTKMHQGLILTICVAYGGREEIMDACKGLLGCDPEGKNMDTEFAKHLMSQDLPDIDLMIRTGGDQRVSNFMLWKLAYAELYFADVLWPDFNPAEFDKALEYFASCRRNFGA